MTDDWELETDPTMIRAARVAGREGRLHPSWEEQLQMTAGHFQCSVCGVRHFEHADALACCAILFGEGPPLGGREQAIAALPSRAGDAYAAVLFPDEFTGALENLMDTLCCRTGASLARSTGLSINFCERGLAGTVSWIGRRNWGILDQVFEGDVPGCEKYPFEDE